MKKFSVCLMILVFCRVLVGCSKQNEEALRPPTNNTPGCDTANIKFAANVVPILSTNCYSCHGNGRSFGGINLDTYAKVKQIVDDGSLLGAITYASGYSPMPKNATQLSTCDINKVRAWINRGALNN